MGTVLARVPSLTTSRSRSEPTAFVFSTTQRSWVNLGFNFASLLSDPDGLLRGDGKWIRLVRIAGPRISKRRVFGSW